MTSEHVEFMEGALIEEVLKTLAGEHLAPLVLAGDRPLRSRLNRLITTLLEIADSVPHRLFHISKSSGAASITQKPGVVGPP